MRFKNIKKVQECIVYIENLDVDYTMFLKEGFCML